MVAKSTAEIIALEAGYGLAPGRAIVFDLQTPGDIGACWATDGAGTIVTQSPDSLYVLSDPQVAARCAALALSVLASGDAQAHEILVEGFPSRSFLLRARPARTPDGDERVFFDAVETTVKDRMIDALKQSRAMFKALVEVAADFSFETDAQGRFRYISGSAAGHVPWVLNGQSPAMLASDAVAAFCPREPRGPVDLWVTSANGDPACLAVTALPLVHNGAWSGSRGVAREVTAERLSAVRLEAAHRRDSIFRAILTTIQSEPDALKAVDRALDLIRDNFAAECVVLKRPKSALSRGQHRRGAVVIEAPCRYRNDLLGTLRIERRRPAWSDDDMGLLTRLADHMAIALAQAEHVEALQRLSSTDGLTGLPNRRAFETIVTERLAALEEAGGDGVLMLLDLDHFKQLNDSLGHAAGDSALKLMAQALEKSLREDDLAARLGGDEFAVWLSQASAATAAAVAERLARTFATSRRRLTDVPLSISIGAASWARGRDLRALLHRADEALYVVKRRGRDGFELAGEDA